jgi:hypothetical protein
MKVFISLIIMFFAIQAIYAQSNSFDSDPDGDLKEFLKLDANQLFKWDSIRQDYTSLMTEVIKNTTERTERNNKLMELNAEKELKQIGVLNSIQKQKYTEYKENEKANQKAEQMRLREARKEKSNQIQKQ